MGKTEESCLNRVKEYYLLNETYYSGITEEEKKSLITLIKTAKDTDDKTTTFPDFIGENGWIEHFEVTSSQSSKKGYESNINHAEMMRSIEQQIDEKNKIKTAPIILFQLHPLVKMIVLKIIESL